MTSDDKAELEAELRSVVQSMKEGISINKIQGDFRSLTGNVIPYSKFGYTNLEGFLRSMPTVVRLERNRNGEVIVHAVANQATQHLTDLISKQKSSKPRRVSKPRNPRKNHNWHAPHTPNRTYNLPSRPPSRNFRNPSLLNNPPFLLNNPPLQVPYFIDYRPCLQPLSYNVPLQDYGYLQNKQRNPGPKVQNFQENRKTSEANGKTSQPNSKQPTGISTNSSKHPVPARVPPPPYKPYPGGKPNPVGKPNPGGKPNPVGKPSPVVVPNRPSRDSNSSVLLANPVPTIEDSSEPGLPWPNPKSNKQLVDNYAFTNGLKCVYRPCEHKDQKKRKTLWLSQLLLDDQKFLSYPVEKNTPDEANEEAARRAVDKLNITSSIVSLPVAPAQSADDIKEIVDNVKQIILETSQGAFHYYVQEQYRKKHRLRLPVNWLELIQNVDLFRVDRADDTHFILFYGESPHGSRTSSPAELTESPVLTNSSKDSSTIQENLLSDLPEALHLPDSKQWGIYVTHASSTANICFRLIDYADQFEEFSQSMEDHYTKECNQELVSFPVCGRSYCVFLDHAWHRVIVQNLGEDGKVLCDFPDVGDSEWLSTHVLYKLDQHFLEMPFQAFRADLAGLSHFADDDGISETLINLVLGKALIAEPTIGDDNNITLVLYDTSTDEDININQLILERIFSYIKAPVPCEEGDLFEGFLGNVLPTGVIELQIMDRRTQLLNSLLENVAEILDAQLKQNPVTEVSTTKKYGVFYNNKWQRAVSTSQSIISDKVSMYLIDSGRHIDMNLQNICKLEGETEILASFPALAVSCLLNGISNNNKLKWNYQVTEKLLNLIPEDVPLIIKVPDKPKGNDLPFVDLFKRLEPDLQLVSINQTLALNFPGTRSFEGPPEVSINNQEDIPEIGKYFDVFIASAGNPNSFICQSIESRSAFSKLFEEMQDFYNSETNHCEMHKKLIHTGEFYALKYKDDCWYRVHVQEILDQDPFTMLVYLVDYGGFEIAKLCDVQTLPKQFRQLQYQAISASLTGTQPVKHEYSPSDTLQFKNMVEEKCFVSVVDAKEQTSSHGLEGTHLSLTLIDTSTQIDLYINQELITKGISKSV